MLSTTPSTLPQVLQCQKPNAGFGGSPRHDPHILYTLSAVQILALYNKTDLLDADAVAACELGVLWALAGPASMPVLCLCPRPKGNLVLWCLIVAGSALYLQQPVYVWSLPALNLCCVFHADIAKLQQPDGSFTGDEWGEVDTRCVCNGQLSTHGLLSSSSL